MSLLLAFWLGFCSVILLLALFLLFKLVELLKGLLDELKNL